MKLGVVTSHPGWWGPKQGVAPVVPAWQHLPHTNTANYYSTYFVIISLAVQTFLSHCQSPKTDTLVTTAGANKKLTKRKLCWTQPVKSSQQGKRSFFFRMVLDCRQTANQPVKWYQSKNFLIILTNIQSQLNLFLCVYCQVITGVELENIWNCYWRRPWQQSITKSQNYPTII